MCPLYTYYILWRSRGDVISVTHGHQIFTTEDEARLAGERKVSRLREAMDNEEMTWDIETPGMKP